MGAIPSPPPPQTLFEETWANGLSGNPTYVKSPGWIGSPTGTGYDNTWIIPDPSDLPSTSSTATDPVFRSAGYTSACYITTTSGSTNTYTYNNTSPDSDNPVVKIYAKFDIPAGITNLQITASYKAKGEDNYDYAFMVITSTDNVSSAAQLENTTAGTFSQLSSGTRYSPVSAIVTSIGGQHGDPGEISDDANDLYGTSFFTQQTVVNSTQWEAGKENIILFAWTADSSFTQPPASIGYIKIVGTST